ncbi:MAG: cytochrome C biogenesis protein [Gemmatimonadales bacterium]|nr:MAG: cytochrome C biogenesis protein [Gemmatimonadales bacterium]
MKEYFGQIWAIAAKDLRVELRTRERVAAMGAFVVLTAILFNYAVDRTVVHPRELAAGMIWIVISLAGLLGLGRTFELEKEDGALDGLLVAPVPRDALYLGKVLANSVLLVAVTALTVAVFALFFQVRLPGNPLPLAGVLLTGTVGFVALGTLFSGITAGTRMGDTLLPILLFPLLVPLITFGAAATADLLAGLPPAESAYSLRILAAFTLVALTAGVGLFRFIVED